MKTGLTPLFVFCMLALSVVACRKRTTDLLSPEINIALPKAGDTIEANKDPEVHIEFTVVDNDRLHHLHVLLLQNGIPVLDVSPDVHNLRVYAFHDHRLALLSETCTYQLKIEAMDQNNNKQSRDISFYSIP